MTNKEYIRASLSNFGVTGEDVELILLKGNLSETAYVDSRACDEAIYNNMSVILKGALQNVKEGDYALSWNMEGIKLYYHSLCKELGKPNVLFDEKKPKPKLRNKSNIW